MKDDSSISQQVKITRVELEVLPPGILHSGKPPVGPQPAWVQVVIGSSINSYMPLKTHPKYVHGIFGGFHQMYLARLIDISRLLTKERTTSET